jgi:hypothetical protein
MNPDFLAAVFMLGNLLVVPPYILMVFLPHAPFTRRVMASVWSVAAPAFFNIVFGMIFVFSDPTVLAQFKDILLSFNGNSFALYLQVVQDFPPAALVMWLHAVAADVVMARWAYLDSREFKFRALWVSPAILLMATNGPLGFAVYVIGRQIALHQRRPPANVVPD